MNFTLTGPDSLFDVATASRRHWKLWTIFFSNPEDNQQAREMSKKKKGKIGGNEEAKDSKEPFPFLFAVFLFLFHRAHANKQMLPFNFAFHSNLGAHSNLPTRESNDGELFTHIFFFLLIFAENEKFRYILFCHNSING